MAIVLPGEEAALEEPVPAPGAAVLRNVVFPAAVDPDVISPGEGLEEPAEVGDRPARAAGGGRAPGDLRAIGEDLRRVPLQVGERDRSPQVADLAAVRQPALDRPPEGRLGPLRIASGPETLGETEVRER